MDLDAFVTEHGAEWNRLQVLAGRRRRKLTAAEVDYIVRLETGVINRAVYQTAVLYDPAVDGEFERANQAFRDILAAGLSLGGTVTGEHGVGKIKQEWLAREIGPVGMRVHRAIKAALDPANLFNPGSMFSMS